MVRVASVDDVDSAVRCIEMGADDYLSKLIDPVVLTATAWRSALILKRARAPSR